MVLHLFNNKNISNVKLTGGSFYQKKKTLSKRKVEINFHYSGRHINFVFDF